MACAGLHISRMEEETSTRAIPAVVAMTARAYGGFCSVHVVLIGVKQIITRLASWGSVRRNLARKSEFIHFPVDPGDARSTKVWRAIIVRTERMSTIAFEEERK